MKTTLRASVLLALLVTAPTATADVAFPARLDVVESEPGVYDITFTLPIIEGRKLRAEPRMPPTCTDVGERATGVSSTGFTSSWTVRCEPASLAGEAILIEGLLGTQTDLAFSLTTLEGRAFSQILRPSRPGFLVPQPPSAPTLMAAAVIEGTRSTLRHPALWLLMMAVVLLGVRSRELALGVAAFAAGHLVAQWLAGQVWLETTPPTRDLLLWAAVVIPAMRLAGGSRPQHGWWRPLWPGLLLLGLVVGGARPGTLPTQGLSSVEQSLALVFFAIGVALGVGLMAAVASEIRAVADLAAGGRWRPPMERFIGYAAGVAAVGLVVTHLAGLVLRVGEMPRSMPAFALLCIVLGPTMALTGRRPGTLVAGFAALAVAGVIPGLLGVPMPLAGLWTIGSLMVCGLVLVCARPVPSSWLLGVAVVAVPVHGWSMAAAVVADMSRSTAVTFGVVLVGVCLFFASLTTSRPVQWHDLRPPVRILGAFVTVVAIGWRLAEYRSWFDHEVATEAALGLARVPVLPLVLLAIAVLTWPRRRRVAEELGAGGRGPMRNAALVGLAAMLVPYGTVAVPNPFFEPHAPRGDDARRVASRVLSDTYHAFNLKNEDVLYDTLSESVVGDLVDEIYLDSRRRLTAGTREGTQVTVREVGVLEIGEPLAGAGAEQGFSYDCRWKVVARVQHLQHVHHRHNIYTGVLTLRSDGGRWKISGVELQSEDRMVVPWQAT